MEPTTSTLNKPIHPVNTFSEKKIKLATFQGSPLAPPTFRPLPPHEALLPIAADVLGRTIQQIINYGSQESARADKADILLRLIRRPDVWSDRFMLCRTPDGGQQVAANTRLCELREDLRRHGFSIACAVDRSGSREKSFYRLVWEDEVITAPRSGRIRAYVLAAAPTKAEQKKPVQSARQACNGSVTAKADSGINLVRDFASLPNNPPLFEVERWTDPEQQRGRRRG